MSISALYICRVYRYKQDAWVYKRAEKRREQEISTGTLVVARMWDSNVRVVVEGQGKQTKGHPVVVTKLAVRGSSVPLSKEFEGWQGSICVCAWKKNTFVSKQR